MELAFMLIAMAASTIDQYYTGRALKIKKALKGETGFRSELNPVMRYLFNKVGFLGTWLFAMLYILSLFYLMDSLGGEAWGLILMTGYLAGIATYTYAHSKIYERAWNTHQAVTSIPIVRW